MEGTCAVFFQAHTSDPAQFPRAYVVTRSCLEPHRIWGRTPHGAELHRSRSMAMIRRYAMKLSAL